MGLIRHNFNGKFGRKTIERERERESISVCLALRVRLDTAYFTKNWKHYSKIIFKCVNNTVWPFFFFFNKVVVGSVNSTWTVHKQCVNSDEQCYLSPKSKKQVNQKKKKKRKMQTQNAGSKHLLN